MQRNYFEQLVLSDNDLCTLVIDRLQITQILDETKRLAGEGTTPKLWLDAEHLQVLNYRTLDGVSDEHRENIDRWHAESPIVASDLAFLALRSLFCFSWPSPQSTEDVQHAARYEAALDAVLLRWSQVLGTELTGGDAPLPNWARLSFLRVMSQIPETAIQKYGLETLVCTLTKQPTFHARSCKTDEYSLIGYNYALEPILKSLNRFTLHYYGTQHLAGPRRIERAWAALAPTVLYFFAEASATALLRPSILFGEDLPSRVHDLTARQLDHITAHEIGHIVLDHSKKWMEAEGDPAQMHHVSHQFEFAADTFAFNVLRSTLLGDLREVSGPSSQEPDKQRCEAISDYTTSFTAIRLLYTYMWFIDLAGAVLRARLAGDIEFRPIKNSHPPARDRMKHLMQMSIGDVPRPDALADYADRFFLEIIKYMADVDAETLLDSVRQQERLGSADA